MGNDLDLAVTLLGDLDLVTEVANTALNLDLLVQELLEGGDIEDLVGGRLRGVDDELEVGARVSESSSHSSAIMLEKDVMAYLLSHLAGLALLL